MARRRRTALRGWLSTRAALTLLDAELDRAIATLHHKAEAFEVQLSDIGLQRLAKADAFRFFRHLVNYDPATVIARPRSTTTRTWTTSSPTRRSNATATI